MPLVAVSVPLLSNMTTLFVEPAAFPMVSPAAPATLSAEFNPLTKILLLVDVAEYPRNPFPVTLTAPPFVTVRLLLVSDVAVPEPTRKVPDMFQVEPVPSTVALLPVGLPVAPDPPPMRTLLPETSPPLRISKVLVLPLRPTYKVCPVLVSCDPEPVTSSELLLAPGTNPITKSLVFAWTNPPLEIVKLFALLAEPK
jgi:hypothetical protein